MNILRKVIKFIFGVALEPTKEKFKSKLDADSARSDSDFVKKRNDIEKLLVDMVDDHTVDRVMDLIDNKFNHK